MYFPYDPLACLWFLQIATFSMLPLLIRDGLLIAYVGINVFYLLTIKIALSQQGRSDRGYQWDVFHLDRLFDTTTQRRSKQEKEKKFPAKAVALFCCYLSWIGAIILLLCTVFVAPPKHLPHLFPLLISAYSCGQFSAFFLYFNYRQFL